MDSIKEVNPKQLNDRFSVLLNNLAFIIGLGLSIYILLDYLLGLSSALPKRAITLAFCLALVFIERNKKPRPERINKDIVSIVLAILGVVSSLYAAFYWWDMALRPTLPTLGDTIACFVAVIITLEACRRAMGKAITLVCIFFIIYGFLGHLIPGHWGHQGFTIERFVDMTYMYADTGLWGMPMRVAVEMVIIFIIYGSMLQKLGGGQFFIDIANALTGKYRGGPAKAAVVGSAFFGSISGSPVANVVGTGAFTIPLMKKTGYRGEFAGAVEAVASTGGQIMPPIMGAAAFLMANLLGVPYSKVALAGVIPAIIFFVSLFVAIHLAAVKSGLKGLSEEDIPSARTVLKEGWYLLLSPILLIYLLVVKQYSVGYSGLFSIIAMVFIYYVQELISKGPRSLIQSTKTVIKALGDGGRSAAGITVAFASVGIVISVLGISGLGLKLAGLLVDISGGKLFLLAIFTGIAAIILGMGLPTSACYIIVAVTAAPALINMGVTPLSAHFFVLYYAILCVITPPVALASFAAAGIADSDPMKTSMEAVKLGLLLFILPFFILINPALLMQGTPSDIILTAISGLVAGTALAITMANYFMAPLNKIQRLFLFGSAFLMLNPGMWTDFIGYGVATVVLIWNVLESRKSKAKPKL